MRYVTKSLPLPALLLIITALTLVLPLDACTPSINNEQATFQVVSLGAIPAEAVPGEEISITAQIQNTGNTMGVYNALMLLDGESIYEKSFMIYPDSIKSISYAVSKQKPGIYTVTLGKSTAHFTIRALIEQEVELKYDSNSPREALWAGKNGGFLIDFTPSKLPFKVDVVRICTGVYGTGWEGKTWELSILDKNKKLLKTDIYPIGDLPVRGAFPFQPPVWADIDIEDTVVTDKFYVYLFTGTGRHMGIHVGVDDSILNGHSELAQGKATNPSVVPMSTLYPANTWYKDGSKVNWMIRVIGTMQVPAD